LNSGIEFECVEDGDTTVAKSETNVQAAARFLRGPHPGNSNGLVLLQSLHEIRAQADRDRVRLESKVEAQVRTNEAQVRIITQLQRDINALKASSTTFTAMKRRCLAIYKRDHHPERMTNSDRADIAARNQEAHGADPMAEAILYKAGGRTDFWLYKDIYIMTPLEVLLISKSKAMVLYTLTNNVKNARKFCRSLLATVTCVYLIPGVLPPPLRLRTGLSCTNWNLSEYTPTSR
jgi:hypothetical protein